MLYFGYGSNMLLARIRQPDRTPSAERVGVGRLPAHVLRFHRRGWDGSGKCNAFCTEDPDDVVHGVLFRLTDLDREALDRAEGVGRGYVRAPVSVHPDDGVDTTAPAFTYVAESAYIDDTLRPFAWYHALVVAGAVENDLPESYVTGIRDLDTVPDPDRQRDDLARQLLPIHSDDAIDPDRTRGSDG